MVRFDGEVMDVEVAGVPIVYQGKPGAQSIVRDVTGRKRAEKVTRESEAKYRALVERSLQGLIVVQGSPPRIVFANSTLAEILGYNRDELLSLSPQQVVRLVHPDDQDLLWGRHPDREPGQ